MNEKSTGRPLAELIAEACSGLTYMSETDAAVEPFFGGPCGEVTAEAIARAAGEQGEKFEAGSAKEFFAKAGAERPWFTDAQIKNARGFARLGKLLSRNTEQIGLFRFGRIRIRIYVAGVDDTGELVGIRTEAVET